MGIPTTLRLPYCVHHVDEDEYLRRRHMFVCQRRQRSDVGGWEVGAGCWCWCWCPPAIPVQRSERKARAGSWHQLTELGKLLIARVSIEFPKMNPIQFTACTIIEQLQELIEVQLLRNPTRLTRGNSSNSARHHLSLLSCSSSVEKNGARRSSGVVLSRPPYPSYNLAYEATPL